jgi:hypothetical protein
MRINLNPSEGKEPVVRPWEDLGKLVVTTEAPAVMQPVDIRLNPLVGQPYSGWLIFEIPRPENGVFGYYILPAEDKPYLYAIQALIRQAFDGFAEWNLHIVSSSGPSVRVLLPDREWRRPLPSDGRPARFERSDVL